MHAQRRECLSSALTEPNVTQFRGPGKLKNELKAIRNVVSREIVNREILKAIEVIRRHKIIKPHTQNSGELALYWTCLFEYLFPLHLGWIYTFKIEATTKGTCYCRAKRHIHAQRGQRASIAQLLLSKRTARYW